MEVIADNKNTDVVVTPPTADNQDKGGSNDDKGTPKTYTQEEHQAELDRIAGTTRKEEKEKADRAIKDAADAAYKKATEDAKLTNEQRETKAREKRDAEVAEMDRNSKLRENKLDAREEFDKLGLPKTLVDFVVDLDKEVQSTKITNFKETWDKALKEALTKENASEPGKDITLNKPADTNKVSTTSPLVPGVF